MRRFTVKVRRGGGRDRFGDDQLSTIHTIEGCTGWPRSSTETNDASNSVVTGRMLSVPFGADLLSTDEVLHPWEDEDGSWWSVEGDVEGWGPHPRTGRRRGAVVALNRASG